MLKSRCFQGGLLVTVLLLHTGAAADGPGGAPPPDLQYRVTLDKAEYAAGEPIVVTAEIFNHGADDYIAQTSTESTAALDGYSFRVSDAAGQPLARPRLLPAAGSWLGSWNRIGRYETHQRKLFLNHWFRPLTPGHYTVRGQYHPRTVTHGQLIDWPPVPAAVVAFSIVPVSPDKLAVRLSRLSDQAAHGDAVAVDFLGFTGAGAAVEPLTAALYHEDPDVQLRAANALNQLTDQTAVRAAVIAAVNERGPDCLAADWLQFHHVSPAELRPLYLAHREAKDPVIRAGVLAGLRECAPSPDAAGFRKEIRATAIAALADPDPRVRREAVLLIATDDSPATADALAAVLRQDRAAAVRTTAAECLHHLRTEAVVPHLRELLLTDIRRQPDYAAQLREIGTPQARAVLQEGLHSLSAEVRVACAGQLWLLKEPAGRQCLVESLRGGEPRLQDAVLDFLQATGPARPAGLRPPPDANPQSWAAWLEKE